MWSIHLSSTILSITTLSSSLIVFSPKSFSFSSYLLWAFSCSSANIFSLLAFLSSNASNLLIPNVVAISWIRASLLILSSVIYASTIPSATPSIIFEILSFKFSPSSTCLLCLYIISLWRFITSSYFNTFFLIVKLRPSTFFCAFSTAFDSIFAWIGIFSSAPKVLYTLVIMSPPNIFIKSSSRPI